MRKRRTGDPLGTLVKFKPPKPCSIEGCDRKAHAKTWCHKHYLQWRRTGHPEHVPDRDRFDAQVERTDTCWLWTGNKTPAGYGRFWLNGRNVQAHRAAYEFHIGPIADGLTIDHLCRVTSCVNPAHMEPVTLAENIRRRWVAA